MSDALAIVELTGLGPAMVVLDTMDKAAELRLLQVELNDFLGVVIKVAGDTASLHRAVEAAGELARRMGADVQSTVLDRPDERALVAIESPEESSPLIQQPVVVSVSRYARTPLPPSTERTHAVSDTTKQALGLIETQGFTAVLHAIDTAVKAADVEVIGKEKLGGGYVTVVIRGDVAAVKAAVDAAEQSIGTLGKLIAAHVIARPSEAILQLTTRL